MFTTEATVSANKIEDRDPRGHLRPRWAVPGDRGLLPCGRGVLQARPREVEERSPATRRHRTSSTTAPRTPPTTRRCSARPRQQVLLRPTSSAVSATCTWVFSTCGTRRRIRRRRRSDPNLAHPLHRVGEPRVRPNHSVRQRRDDQRDRGPGARKAPQLPICDSVLQRLRERQVAGDDELAGQLRLALGPQGAEEEVARRTPTSRGAGTTATSC